MNQSEISIFNGNRKGLGEKPLAFCRAVADGQPGREAAVSAGYAVKNASSQAARLLKRADIQAHIAARRADTQPDAPPTKTRTIIELQEIYKRCMQKEPVMAWDKEARAHVPTGQYQFDVRGATKALELIARLMGQLDGNADGGGAVAVVITDDYGQDV